MGENTLIEMNIKCKDIKIMECNFCHHKNYSKCNFSLWGGFLFSNPDEKNIELCKNKINLDYRYNYYFLFALEHFRPDLFKKWQKMSLLK